MTMSICKTHVLAGIACLIVLAGCNNANESASNSGQNGQASSEQADAVKPASYKPDLEDELDQLGAAYGRHIEQKGEPPSSWDDLKSVAGSSEAFERLREENVVVEWGLRYRDQRYSITRCIVAHFPGAPEHGGTVLLLDGRVIELTPAQIELGLDLREGRAPADKGMFFDRPQTAQRYVDEKEK